MSSGTLDKRNQVILVDENDQVIGLMDKFEAHRNPPKLHRAVSVWLMNSRGQLLFQQRSQHKFTGQGWWANTICGNVFPDEEYEACAYRRLREELGITEVKVEALYTFRYWTYVNQLYGEHEMDRVFIGIYDGVVEPNPLEASDSVWLDMAKLQASELTTQPYITAEESVKLSWAELPAQTSPLEVTANRKSYVVVPWSVMMWHDPRLQAGLKQLKVA